MIISPLRCFRSSASRSPHRSTKNILCFLLSIGVPQFSGTCPTVNHTTTICVLTHWTKDEKTRHLSDCGVCLRSATSASSFAAPKPLESSLSPGKSASSSSPMYGSVFNLAPCSVYEIKEGDEKEYTNTGTNRNGTSTFIPKVRQMTDLGIRTYHLEQKKCVHNLLM